MFIPLKKMSSNSSSQNPNTQNIETGTTQTIEKSEAVYRRDAFAHRVILIVLHLLHIVAGIIVIVLTLTFPFWVVIALITILLMLAALVGPVFLKRSFIAFNVGLFAMLLGTNFLTIILAIMDSQPWIIGAGFLGLLIHGIGFFSASKLKGLCIKCEIQKEEIRFAIDQTQIRNLSNRSSVM
jgi:hypothetical protein